MDRPATSARPRTTPSNPANGYDGYPVIAAYGAHVLVAWISARRRDDLGQDLDRPRRTLAPDDATTITSSQVWDMSAAGSTGPLALAWAQAERHQGRALPERRVGLDKTVASFSSTGTYKTGYGTSITMAGTAGSRRVVGCTRPTARPAHQGRQRPLARVDRQLANRKSTVTHRVLHRLH